jgi:serine/threonine-protein kinase
VAEPVERAVDTALAKAPADRFPTAADFARALDSAATTTAAPAARPAMPATPTPSSLPPASASTSTRTPLPARRRVPVAAAALGLGFLVGIGALFAWRHHVGGTEESASAGPVRLAVLPFDNLGDSSEAYFADGLTDAVRGKLTGVPGLAVIAPASSAQYRRTTKTPAQIGQELGGVRYLLVGKVRWAKGPGATSRVQVSPALVDVTSGTDIWEQPFDAPLTDVFQVQADIASKVAEQLRVRLGTEERNTLAQRPTADLDAYDAYLRGKAIAASGNSPIVQRRAAQAFIEAVRRDSTFALAWVGLADSYSLLYSNGVPTPEEADSTRLAAERALALAPDLPDAHGAMALYYTVERPDYVRAFAEDSAGLSRAPNNTQLLARAGDLEERLGQWDAAVTHDEQAARLDPQSVAAADRVAFADLRLRRYAPARTAEDRALALQPDNLGTLENRVMISLAQGDLAGARAVLRAAPSSVDPSALVAYVAEYWDLGWVLDSAQERTLLSLTPASFDNSREDWATVLAEQYALRGDRVRSRAYADSARIAYEPLLKATPTDAGLHVEYGLDLAYLGRKAEAIENGQRAAALMPTTQDARDGPYMQHQLVRIYLLVGETDKALDALEPLLRIPYYLSPAWLRIDPTFAPLHGNPRFERLIAAGS